MQINKGNYIQIDANNVKKGDIIIAKIPDDDVRIDDREYVLIIAEDEYDSKKDSIHIKAFIGLSGTFYNRPTRLNGHIRNGVKLFKPTIWQYCDLGQKLKEQKCIFNKKTKVIERQWMF